jgi:hypothetical protein
MAAMPGVAFAQANPSPQDTQNARNNPCADPWVSLAVSISKGPTNGVPGRAAGSGNADECYVGLYNNGHWNTFAELVGSVRATRDALASQNLRMEMRGHVPVLAVIDMNRLVAGLNPSQLVATGGGNIIAAGAGNLVATGGGNVIAAGAGNYHVMSVDTKCEVKLPGGMMIKVKR